MLPLSDKQKAQKVDVVSCYYNDGYIIELLKFLYKKRDVLVSDILNDKSIVKTQEDKIGVEEFINRQIQKSHQPGEWKSHLLMEIKKEGTIFKKKYVNLSEEGKRFAECFALKKDYGSLH